MFSKKEYELVGTYNPVGEDNAKINEEVALKWLANGAKPTDTVRSLLSKEGIMKEIPLLKRNLFLSGK